MLSEQMKAEGWIEHDGGECPVPLNSRPQTLHRTGAATNGLAKWSEEWGRWAWKGSPYEGWGENIIAYRLETGHD